MDQLKSMSDYAAGKKKQMKNENVETDDDMFQHDEADSTIISHVLRAASEGKHFIRVIKCHDDVFVFLVYWVYKNKIKAKVQMEKWDGT